MKSNVYCYLGKGDKIILDKGTDEVHQHRLILHDITVHIDTMQLLDLGMKIQSVVNKIDRENAVKLAMASVKLEDPHYIEPGDRD